VLLIHTAHPLSAYNYERITNIMWSVCVSHVCRFAITICVLYPYFLAPGLYVFLVVLHQKDLGLLVVCDMTTKYNIQKNTIQNFLIIVFNTCTLYVLFIFILIIYLKELNQHLSYNAVGHSHACAVSGDTDSPRVLRHRVTATPLGVGVVVAGCKYTQYTVQNF